MKNRDWFLSNSINFGLKMTRKEMCGTKKDEERNNRSNQNRSLKRVK